MAQGTCSLGGCTKTAYCRTWCKAHYGRWQRTGSPRGSGKRGNGEVLAILRSAAATVADECVMLTGYRNRPNVEFAGKRMQASRAAWIIAFGDPGVMQVLHTCHRGEEGCINLGHLYLGDQAQNISDMDEAGRRGWHPPLRLSADQVREIRRRHVRGINHIHRSNTRELAAEFGVSKSAIVNVVAYRARRSVVGVDPDQAIADLERELGGSEAATPEEASGASAGEG